MNRFFAAVAASAFACLGLADRSDALSINGQTTWTSQGVVPFHSPYAGAMSFDSVASLRTSETFTVGLTWRASASWTARFDLEMARGTGVGSAVGLAGYVNGDVIRNPDLGGEVYVARAYAQWSSPAKGGGTLRTSVGKLATTDFFDAVSIASSTRTQFMNWALINDAAYDYAADTRGYTIGAVVEWETSGRTVRLGRCAMPTTANGPTLEADLTRAYGDQLEVEWRLHTGGVWRARAYRNVADMGSYADATANGVDVASTRKDGREKVGGGISYERSFASGGGWFVRAGWSDGRNETFAYTEADDHLSAGVQIGPGRSAHSPTFGFAIATDGLSAPHRRYLAAGGSGFMLGDGALRYGRETVVETYCAWPLGRGTSLTADVQLINHPGYNADRGAILVPGIRWRASF